MRSNYFRFILAVMMVFVSVVAFAQPGNGPRPD